MRYSLATFILILVLVKIDELDSKPVTVVYTGDGCECAKNLPLEVNIPIVPEPAVPDCPSYGYKIEQPPAARAKYSYSFDFVVDEPIAPVPKPILKQNLFATVDKIVLPKPDCVLEAAAPCGIPAPAPPPPPPALEFDYLVNAPLLAKPCLCGKCLPGKPQCRYVLSDSQRNSIARNGGRSKRDASLKDKQYTKKIRGHLKTLKFPKYIKSKLVKRDIKGEYDMLEREQAALDLTLPEIIQYMPETLMPNFKRGKCNIGCKSCKNKRPQKKENDSRPETGEKNNDEPSQQLEKPLDSFNESTPTEQNQQFQVSPRYVGANYLKRSVTPYQYPRPCYQALIPPPYVPSPLHLATLAQNPGNPIWYKSRPLIDPNGDYVYDRLGHKYEVKNGSLKLVTPQTIDEVNASVPIAPAVDNLQATASGVMQPFVGGQQLLPAPMVGAPGQYRPPNDPHMDKVIRDIIYQHPDFIDATEHAPGSLTMPQNVQSGETLQFLDKLIRGRLNNWFGVNEGMSRPNVHDINRYTRETGTSIKFIPVVTVDKGKLDKYRKRNAKVT